MTILAAAALLVTAAACSNDDHAAAVDNNETVPVSITAAMAGNAASTTPAAKSAAQPGTRAVGARWNQDHIGVVMYTVKPNPTGGTDIFEYGRVRNAHYATTSTGTDATFTPDKPADAIYLSDADGTVIFAAYAPYQPSTGSNGLPGADGVIVLDATLQVNADPAEARRQQDKLDFLLAAGATASKQSPVVRFTVDDGRNYSFHHMMTRLILKIQSPAANGFDPADAERISGISIGNVCTKTRMAFLEEGFDFPGLNNHDPASWKQDWNITHAVHRYDPNPTDPATGLPVGTPQLIYTLIIPPQSLVDAAGNDVPALSLSVTLDGNTYKNNGDIKGELNAPGLFHSGTSYEYTISLKKNALEVSGATITDWAVGTTGSGDAVWE